MRRTEWKMIKIGNDQLIKRAVSFRNKMNETNCTVEDIMKIYIGIPISDYFYKNEKNDEFVRFVPSKRKLYKRNYFV